MKKRFSVSILFILLFSCVSQKQAGELSIEYYNIANGLMEIDKIEDAIEYYNKSLEIDYNNNSSRYNLSLAYVKAENFDLALDHIELLLVGDSKNNEVLALKAYSLYKIGNFQESLKVYKKLDSVRKSDTGIKLNISKVLYQLEEYEEALEYVVSIIEDSNDIEFKLLYQMAGKILYKLDDLPESVRYYELYLDEKGSDVDVLLLIKDIYIELEDVKSEKAIIVKLLEDKDFEKKSELYFRLGEIYLLESDFSNGYENLKKSVDEGFNNKDSIEKLLETPDLIEVDKIRELFK